MRSTLAICIALLLVAGAGAAPVPPPNPREAGQLIQNLGSEDFAEREAATKRLDELGLLALAELRAATKSENLEIADRAKDLVRKIERRAANERAIAPTLVELDFKDMPLDAVLSALSKQVGYEVVLGGPKANELADTKVTVATGKVPFWTAVQKVCAAGELQVASAGGFAGPGATPYNVRPGKRADGTPVRVAANHNAAVVLEARDGKKRPASVHGAVLVEAFELPQAVASKQVAAVILQVWPEPKLTWQSNADAKVTNATDPDGKKLIPDFSPTAALPQVQRVKGGDAVVVRNPDGTLTVVNGGAANPLAVGPNFTPNPRQSLVKLKTGAGTATELTGSVYGLMRSGVEPLAVVALDPEKAVTAGGVSGVELTAAVRKDANGKTFAEVKVLYDPLRVQPARPGDELVGVKLSAGASNATVLGVRVTDSDGTALDLVLSGQRIERDPTGRRMVAQLTLEVLAPKDGAKVTFWGSFAKPVEVPFVLKDVPLVGGPK